MTPCTHCGRPVTLWETVDYPPDWIKQHPELAGMCLQCYQDWCLSNKDNEIIHVGGLAANPEEKRILDGLMVNLMKKKDGAA